MKMKTFSTLTILFLSLFSVTAQAQTVTDVSDFTVSASENTLTGKSGGIFLVIQVQVNDLPNGASFQDQADLKVTGLSVLRKSDDSDEPYLKRIKQKLSYSPNSIFISLEMKTKQDIEWFFQNTKLLRIQAENDIQFPLDDGNFALLKKDALNSLDYSSVTLSSAGRDDLINSLGKYKSIYYDRFDAGWRDSESDSVNPGNYIDFAKSFNLFNIKNLSFEIEGLLSTDINDVASYLQVTPIYFDINDKWSINASYQTSVNEKEQRVMGRISYRGVIKDNPFDVYVQKLSYGYSRLRLKPYLNVGVTAMYFTESENPDLKESQFFEPFVSLLYIIPISEKYTARLDTYAYWRSQKDKLDFISENLNWQGTIQLGYGIGKNAQIVGKYSYGTVGLTNETNNRLMIGFLTEILNN